MKITILTDYVRGFVWSPTAWAADLGHALAARGHRVTVACDGLEDPSVFTGLSLVVRRPERTLRGSDPLGFLDWSCELGKYVPADATISLTPLAPGDLWMPLSPSTLAELVPSLRAHTPVSALLEILARPWLPIALLAESRAHRGLHGRPAPFVAALGRLESRGGVHALGYASRFARPDTDRRRDLRDQTRRLLGISPDRPVVLLSAVHAKRPGLSTMLAGFASLRRNATPNAPLLLVMGRRAHHLHREAARADGVEGLRFLGGTARADAAFAAADLAVAPWSASMGSSTGRFIADALRLGVPVVAHRQAPGAELIEPAHFGTPEIGSLLEHPTAHDWQAALGDYLSRDRINAATRAAHDVSGVVSMSGLVTRIESILSGLGR